jgi:hypothetical protein
VEDHSPVVGSVVKGILRLLKCRSLVVEGAPMTFMGTVALRSPLMWSAVPSM